MNTTHTAPRPRPLIGSLVAVGAAAVLALTAVGVVVAATPGEPETAAPVTQTDVVPAPVSDHPSEILEPEIPGPEVPDIDLDPVGEPADSFDADPAGLTIGTFEVSNTSVLCNTQSPVPSEQHLQFAWEVEGAAHVFFGVDTTDAQAEPMFTDLALSGRSSTHFPEGYGEYTYACPEPSHQYTLTAVDSNGYAVSKTVTVVNNGDTTS